ncbi:flagellar hook-basal body complex protein [Massilia sp. MB5]|uniref:flagellar hook protein FlgE n=1 Tax=unclassified Massilia TaxID=2609279 RepID=UPI00067B742C|nr:MULTISPECIES: flagellar hook-basal body complex protein [unclassified Massilia]AKU20630.1 flagellar biosynthesis protein FlgE [Massilia sp. NR 4-1]UMR29896.1 flagellar hook-basal body complex protein [Massilia sp. MB5]
MSFDIALSGIQAINEQLSTISNNVANAGTLGFKSSRANFSAMYAGERPTGTRIGSTSQSITQNGGVLTTNRGLDALINGRGFFVAKDSTGQMNYTRVGLFEKAADNFIIDASGRRVQGYAMTPPSTVRGAMGDIVVPTGTQPGKPSTKIDFQANMSADWKVPANPWPAAAPASGIVDPLTYNMSKSSVIYDSLGKQHPVTQYFRKAAAGTDVEVYVSVDGAFPTALAATLKFDTAGKLTGPLSYAIPSFTPPGAAAVNVTIGYTGTTFQAGEANTSVNAADGNAPGTYVGVELNKDGGVIAKYSNGQKQQIAVIAVATFPNDEGLIPADNTSWIAGGDSGVANYAEPGQGVAGSLNTGSLEQSNVDVTTELVSLMTSQRNYQANSKVISTENAMLQSLMQAL